MGKPPKLRRDVNEVAHRIAQAATGEAEPPTPPGTGEPNPEAVRRGRKGGKKGGRARAERLTPEQRKEIAELAAASRWLKKKSSD